MNPNNAARFTTPISPESPQDDEGQHPWEPLSPESIASPSPALKPYRFEWATDPYDPTKHLGPLKVAIRNQLFTVDFRISSPEVFRPQIRMDAKVYPGYNEVFHLCTERVTVNEWKRVALFIPREGFTLSKFRFTPTVQSSITGWWNLGIWLLCTMEPTGCARHLGPLNIEFSSVVIKVRRKTPRLLRSQMVIRQLKIHNLRRILMSQSQFWYYRVWFVYMVICVWVDRVV